MFKINGNGIDLSALYADTRRGQRDRLKRILRAKFARAASGTIVRHLTVLSVAASRCYVKHGPPPSMGCARCIANTEAAPEAFALVPEREWPSVPAGAPAYLQR